MPSLKSYTMPQIAKAIEEHSGYTLEHLRGGVRYHELFWYRQIAYFMASEADYQIAAIAAYFNRSENLVLRLVREMNAMPAKEVIPTIEAIESRIKL